MEAYSLAANAHASLSHIRQLIPCQRTSIVLLDFNAQMMQVLAIHAEGGPHAHVGAQLPFPSPSFIQQFQRGVLSRIWIRFLTPLRLMLTCKLLDCAP